MSSYAVLILSCVLACGLAYPAYPDITDEILDLMATEEPYGLEVDSKWPDKSVAFGQVAGIEAGLDNKVYVFHRGSVEWGFDTFDENNTFTHPEDGAIKEKTISIIDAKTGKEISALGEEKFYMPHGLTVDAKGNIWVTDVALHQVMRFARGSKEPDMVLGEKLVPGSDDTHFCKPTDVAVASTGVFFVSDGYCNSRVMKFNEDGTVAKVWGEAVTPGTTQPGPMDLNLPHSVTLVEDYDMVCVADRENQRVQCYNAGLQDPSKTGEFIYTPFANRGGVFALDYDQNAEVLYVVVRAPAAGAPRGYTVRLDGTVLEEWWPQGDSKSLPHDVSVSPDGSDVYVGDVAAHRAIKFERRPSIMV